MAIVRTTPKETNTGGTVPPTVDTPAAGSPGASAQNIDKTKSVVAQRANNAAARATASRTGPAARPVARRAAAGSQVVANRGASKPFVHDTIAELRRVVWPDREKVRAGTLVTIGLLIFFGLYISGLDLAANWLFHALGLYE